MDYQPTRQGGPSDASRQRGDTPPPPQTSATGPNPPVANPTDDSKPWWRRWWAIGLWAALALRFAVAVFSPPPDLAELSAADTAPEALAATDSSPRTGSDQDSEPGLDREPEGAVSAGALEPEATPVTEATTTSTIPATTTTIPIIEDGTYIVGAEITPGTYRVGRYWALLDAETEIIDNELVAGTGMLVVNVPATASFVEVSGEMTALDQLPVVDPIKAGFDSGTYLVGVDVDPGQYRVRGSDLVYLASLQADGTIIDNTLGESSVILKIPASAWALEFNGGTLERIG